MGSIVMPPDGMRDDGSTEVSTRLPTGPEHDADAEGIGSDWIPLLGGKLGVAPPSGVVWL